jgi:hypothetical protein
MSSSKKLTCIGTLRQVFIRVYTHRLEIQSVMLVFSAHFVNYLLPSLWFIPPPSRCQSTVYTDSVWLGGGGGGVSTVGDHILQEFNTLYLTKFRTYKIASPPQTKTYEWRGPQSAAAKSLNR